MLAWTFKKKKGEIYHDKWVMDIFDGNAFVIALYRREDGQYDMPPIFFTDKAQARRALGLAKGTESIFEKPVSKLVLYRNMWSKKELKDMVEIFADAFDEITIEIKKEEEK